MNKVLAVLTDSCIKFRDNDHLKELGKHMFTFHTQHGFPPDFFFDALSERKGIDLTIEQKVFVTSEYQERFIEHRRLAGVEEKNLEKARLRNREVIERLINTGELGIY